MERIQKEAIHDYECDYETLLQRANMSTLQIGGRIKTLATEIFKTFHSLNKKYKMFKEFHTHLPMSIKLFKHSKVF